MWRGKKQTKRLLSADERSSERGAITPPGEVSREDEKNNEAEMETECKVSGDKRQRILDARLESDF